MKSIAEYLRSRGLALLSLAVAVMPPGVSAAQVRVYGDAVQNDQQTIVSLYADITGARLCSFGVKLRYDPVAYSLVKAVKHEAAWFMGTATAPLPYVDPDTSLAGEVVLLGGKLDLAAATDGVTGTGVLLGTVTLAPSSNAQPILSLSLGRPAPFANFVAVDGTVFDTLPGGVEFGPVTVNGKFLQTIAFAPLADRTYGDADFTLSATAASGLPVNYTVSDPAVATVVNGTVHILAAGFTDLTASQPGNANYAPAADVTQRLVVNQAPLTITADNATQATGEPVPTFTARFAGLRRSDTVESLNLPLQFSTDATPDSPKGDYTITVNGPDQTANYRITYHAGTLRLLGSRVLYVNVEAAGANNGQSWAEAYRSLQDALAAAEPGQSIWVAAGTYRPGDERWDSFHLKTGVPLYGGFAGTETNVTQRDPWTYRTILSGEIGDPSDRWDNVYHVIVAAPSTRLDGFTVTRACAGASGQQDEGAPEHRAGGMDARFAEVVVANSRFIDNCAEAGGGLCAGAGTLVIDCEFIRNKALYNGNGGGAASDGATFVNCSFIQNVAGFPGSAWCSEGAGIFSTDSRTRVINCTLRGNRNPGYVMFGDAGWNWQNPDWGLPSVPTDDNEGQWLACPDADPVTGPTTIVNSILADPFRGDLEGFGAPADLTITFSCLPNAFPGEGNIVADPRLGDDLRMAPDSPCLDAGANDAVPPEIQSDLAGQARVANGLVDLGAYEYQAPAMAALLMDGQYLVNGQFQFTLQGSPHGSYVIQASTNLTTWAPLTTHTIPAAGVLRITNLTSSSSLPRQFYRAIQLQP